MGKKDSKKKGKGAEKTATKTEKKVSQKLKKQLKLKGEEDIDVLIAKFVEDDRKKNEITETLVKPPSKRSSFTITAHPDKDQLILFGGEYFNGTKALLYNELYFYSIKQDRWTQVVSPGGPPPRCSHQAVALSQGGGQLWIFGGEFTSETQSQFHHYKDLWVFYFNSKKWEKIPTKGTAPSARSGHRMVAMQKQLFIFGGFQDNSQYYRYFNDIYSFSLETYTWTQLELNGKLPSPRSGCQMMPISDGRILVYGGYSREKVKKDVDKGTTHEDMFVLTASKSDSTGKKWTSQLIKQKQNSVQPPPRCAFTMALAPNDRAYMFGGVFDEEDEEELQGLFYNDLHLLDLNKQIWHKVKLKGKKEDNPSEEAKKEDVVEEMEVEEKVISDDGVFTVTVGPSSQKEELKELTTKSDIFVPPPRINPGMVIKKGTLYLYGGMYEEGDKQLTLNDFYSLELNKIEEWRTIIALKKEDLEWFDSDDGEESEDDDSDEDDSDDDEE